MSRGAALFPLLRATLNYSVNAHHMYTHVWDAVSTGAGAGSLAGAAGGGPGTPPSLISLGTGIGVGGGSGSASRKGSFTLSLDSPGTGRSASAASSPGKSAASSPGIFRSPVSPGKEDRRHTVNVTVVGPMFKRDEGVLSVVEAKTKGTPYVSTNPLSLLSLHLHPCIFFVPSSFIRFPFLSSYLTSPFIILH